MSSKQKLGDNIRSKGLTRGKNISNGGGEFKTKKNNLRVFYLLKVLIKYRVYTDRVDIKIIIMGRL